MIIVFVVSDVLFATGLADTGVRQAMVLVAGICAWLAAFLLLRRVAGSQLLLVSLLLFTGVGLLLYVAFNGGAENSTRVATAISGNAGLLSMIITVGFLKLIALPDLAVDDSPLPRGRRAFLDTMITVALFGSFINISAPVLIADRLSLRAPLTPVAAATLTRVFSGSSSWSPFFGGMAVVLTYVQADLLPLMGGGLPFAIIGFAVAYLLGITWHRRDLADFRGYPMKLSSLWIPAMLALTVMAFAWLMPRLSILAVIALGALAMTALALLITRGLNATLRAVGDFIVNELPKSVNELVLFLAAGVLAAGLAGLVDLGVISISIDHFDATTASLLLGGIILGAICGIHPIIQVASLTPLLSTISPDPVLLALTYLFGWSLGTCGGPLSGTHLIFQGRYGIASWQGALRNWPYVVIMYAIAVLLLHLYGQFWLLAS